MRRLPRRKWIGWALVLGLAATRTAMAQSGPIKGQNAFGDWRADRPGTVRLITPADLLKPGATASAGNASRVVPRPRSAVPKVPDGFKIDLFAQGLNNPRELRVDRLLTQPFRDDTVAADDESGPGGKRGDPRNSPGR